MELLYQAPAGFQLISGDDVLAAPAILMGYRGVISVLGNALPAPMQALVKAALRQDIPTVQRLQSQLLPLMRLCFAEGNPTSIKGLLAEMGLIQPYTRLPLVPASPHLRQKAQQALLPFFATGA